MLTGVIAWVIAALVYYALLRRVTYNLFDPLIVVGLFIPFSAALLAVLCESELVAWDKFLLFSIVLFGYLIGARFIGSFFARTQFRAAIGSTLALIRGSEITAILLLTAGITLVLAILGLQMDAQGDARQEFAKLFRPLVVFQSGLFLLSLVLLLSPKISPARAAAWAVLFVVLSIPFSGKSIMVPLLFWYGLRLYVSGRKITVHAMVGMALLVLLGVGVMGLIAYQAGGERGLILLVIDRLMMSGDVYIYAYQSGALAAIRSSYNVSFLAYMLHPITALFGVRGYDKPLGSTLASEVTGTDVLTGPNPQLPVVLDYFFPDLLLVSFLIAFMIGALAIGLRPLSIVLAKSRSRYVRLGGIAAGIFCPAAGFQDTSQVLISLTGVAVATGFGVAMELLFTRPTQHDLPTPTGIPGSVVIRSS